MSKSGVAVAFGTKEALQLAAVDAARTIFVTEVVEPAMTAAAGVARLRSLLDAWLDYATSGAVFPGGCFIVATRAEYDSRPGPVRDALAEQHDAWIDLLADNVRAAQAAGALTELAAEVLAFEIDAVLAATVPAVNLGDASAAARARALLEHRLG